MPQPLVQLERCGAAAGQGHARASSPIALLGCKHKLLLSLSQVSLAFLPAALPGALLCVGLGCTTGSL